MRIGGVERSLVGLLNSFDYSKYEVDLFLFIHDGELLSLIPNEVHLLPENKKYKSLLVGIKENIRLGNWKILYQKYQAKKAAEKYISTHHLSVNNMVYINYLQKYVINELPIFTTSNYDLAISFLTPHYIAIDKVKAKKKIAWIHTDYSFFEFDKFSEIDMWKNYDKIASISQDCTKGFIEQFPELEDKIIEIENILHPDFIKKQALAFNVENEMPFFNNELRFCSIGRFTHEKNFDSVPHIAKILKGKGVKFKWYLIGFGGDEDLIKNNIKEEGMEQYVIILGKKDNPYPYLNACDIYIQPSRYEGKAVTVREAQILEKPVVITNFATSSSQLNNGIDGLIVPMDHVGCAEGILNLINQPDLLKTLSENCRKSDFGNQKEIHKIENLIE